MTGLDDADHDEPGDDDLAVDDRVDGGVDDELTIREASELLNVPAPTIRSWERRYGVPLADRSIGGHRRYARAQLDELSRMRDLIARGRRTVEAAALVKSGHPSSPEPLVEAFLEATRELAPADLARTLDAALEVLGLDRTVDEVLLPALRGIGESWVDGRFDVSHEHVATSATQSWLAALRPTGPLRPTPPIILSCGPLDHHTLGLEAIGALLRQRHWDCRMLGARTPGDSLTLAATETDAIAVVLVCHVVAGRKAAVAALRSAESSQRHVFYAGGAFQSRRARLDVPGQYLGTHLARAADLITATLTSTPTS
ncbi:MAG: MerR family transcriptional regulator [Propionibacteriaceae bacterium]